MPQLPRVEKAWLEAAKNGDVDQMKTLRKWYPQWLNLSRTVDEDTATNDSDGFLPSRSPGFCSWDGFHLRTVGASALHTATWHGDNKIVQYLLEEGQDPKTEDESGMTAIVLAIMHHNLQATRCVYRERVAIQRNLVMDCREEDDLRTRHTVSLIQLFLRFNANVDKQCQRGKTALHHATTDDAYEVARLLLSSGASVDAQDGIRLVVQQNIRPNTCL
ncbi:Ankyrin repeat [Phytophthora infestans]|uniref:Ankyrin repeat n=1 Tax=Phytophthora infestans TaxID=4787 RepID=A0A833WIQ4_PHYIN|nr:Ankyrin repeat [Phytophthora infestans]